MANTNKDTLKAKLSAIGDAIREKTASTNTLSLDEMPIAILNIEGGGGGEYPNGEEMRW